MSDPEKRDLSHPEVRGVHPTQVAVQSKFLAYPSTQLVLRDDFLLNLPCTDGDDDTKVSLSTLKNGFAHLMLCTKPELFILSKAP